jgi:16S rRNA (adenine1518-N6/adenine1519-N6)-dimethyltransferase
MTLSEIKALLGGRGIRLTKSLGQSFLHDMNQVARIVAAAELTPGDRVLEIGPGLGPLTERLVRSAAQVLAIEKDARLAEALAHRLGRECQDGMLVLIHEDALDYLRREVVDWSGWKLVANLPFSVGSQILVEFVLRGNGPGRMAVTLQLEVARRLLAKAGGADYGLLTLLVQLDYTPAAWFRIPASCFFPEPTVDSACICLVRRETPLVSPEQRAVYLQVVKRSFSQRRKMMLKLLREDWAAATLDRSFERRGIPKQSRAEAVSFEQFVGLSKDLATELPHG